MTQLRIVALCCSFLTACGGGGGSGGASGGTAPPPLSQSIAFADAGPLEKFLGDEPYSDVASGGDGAGSVTYASDTPGVAAVDPILGTVTIKAVGIATITATKAADSAYASAHAAYTLRVAPKAVTISAWVGPSDTAIQFPPLPLSLDFVRTFDFSCDPTVSTTCTNGARDPTTPSFLDSTATLHRPARYWLGHGSQYTDPIVVPEQRFATQIDPGVAVLNGRLWVVADPPPHEVWSSADGVNWRMESPGAGFPPRTNFKLVAFNNALWVIGGLSGGSNLTDVWTSSDGIAWAQVTATTPFPPRGYFAAAAGNGRIWISGGWNGTIDLNDVWSSADGATWTQATAAATQYGREQHELLFHNGKLWIVGGWPPLPDVWSSVDGASWSEETATAEFGQRFAHRVVSDGTRMWLSAGRDGYQSARNDVWSSADGRVWTQATASAEFAIRAEHGAAYWNGQLWIVGGTGGIESKNEVWSSTTGDHWTRQSLSARIPGLMAVVTVSYQNRLWVIGEDSQLWSSADGFTWSEETHVLPGLHTSPPGTMSPQLVALPDRLLLISGYQYDGTAYYREVWQSTDGRNWSQVAGSVPFSANGLEQIVAFKGQIWAFADSNPVTTTPEIWSSSDSGASWTRVSVSAPFGPRNAYQVLVYNSQLWVIGGTNPMGSPNDIWSSADGTNWTQITNTGLPSRTFGPGAALATQMCVYGQFNAPNAPHDAWCSSTGTVWQKVSDNAPYGPVTSLNGMLFMVGNADPFSDSYNLVWKSDDGIAWRLGYTNTMRFQ